MDSYDLFGEDGGSSMLDGLTDFGGDNLDSGAPRDSTGSYVAQQPPPQQQQQQQQPQQYGQPIPQESPLQKLASFGGDFGHMESQQQQGLYHQAHPGYTPSSARPLAPTTGPSYQPHVRSHRPSGQFGPYPSIPENMYSMERQQNNLQGWNGGSGYPGSMRHYGGQMSQPQSGYRQHVGYSQQQAQQQQQAEKIPQQYATGQMMGYQQYPPGSHFSGSYDSYGRMTHHTPYQQNTPQSSQYSQSAQQSQYPSSAQQYGHMQTSQMMGYHQQNQHPGHGTRPSGVEVPGYPQKPMPPSLGAGSPQYRAPFPQLSPQMSPRSQMSPRPQPPTAQQQMSPRPVMSPAKPTTLSPHPLTPKATSSPAPNFGPQSTLQQLEQMVPPYQTRTQPQANPQSPALGARVPLSPQPWSQPQPSSQQQSTSVESQIQSTQDNISSFHSISTTEEAITTSTLEPPVSSEKVKTNINLEPHSSTLMDNNSASPSDSGGPSSSMDSKASEPKSKQPHSSPLHPQGQLPNSSPHHQPHSSPHQSTQVSQGLSPHPSHASPHPSHTSPHPAPSHPSPHPSLSSPHLSPGQPLQSPHPTTSQPPQSASSSQPGSQQIKEQENKIDNSGSHQILSPTQHVISASHHPSHQSSAASQQMNISGPQIGLNPADQQSNAQMLGSQSQGLGGVMGSLTSHQNLSGHSMQGVGGHMSSHGQIGSHMGQHMNQQHLGPGQTHMSHLMGPNQNQSPQMIPASQQQPQPPHIGHGMSHMNQSSRFSDYSGSQYQNAKIDDMMGVESRQFGSQMETGGIDHPSSRAGRMLNMSEQMLGMSNQQGMDPAAMRMMAGRQQTNIYSSSPNAMMSGGTMMGMGMSGGSEMFSHQQEMAALQQQLQELYCMPPAPIHQEKMTQLEERLRTLQQHEAATQCQGGPLCVLPGPMFGASLIQGSPQVTSTTGRGRGRGRGPAKPRKTKKQKLAEQQQQQLLEQQHMLMHQQQQYRQMGYQSKGMPHEMNPMMAGTMGTMPNMPLMNNMGANMVGNNPNMGMNPLQSNPNMPAPPNINSGSLMPPNSNIPPGITSNQGMTTGPPNMPMNPNLVANPNMPMNPNLNSNLNISSNNPNMTSNTNLLLNPGMGSGMTPSNSNMMSNPNMSSGNVGMTSNMMTSNMGLTSPNVNIPNQSIQGMGDMNPHQGVQPQSHSLGGSLSQSQNSNQNQIQTQNMISSSGQNMNLSSQNMQQSLPPSIPMQQTQQMQQQQPPPPQQQQIPQLPTQQQPPTTTPPPPPQPPQQVSQMSQQQTQAQQQPKSQSQPQIQSQQQQQQQQSQQPTSQQTPPQSQMASHPVNSDGISPSRQSSEVRTPSPDPSQVKLNSPVETTAPEPDMTQDEPPANSSPSSSLPEPNINNSLSQPEVNTTCDVDSSTNPEQESQSMNPYDFQSSFCSPYEKNSYPREMENNEIDPYLMTDEALGGEIIPRKIRKPRKPREPKSPKEPKLPKEPKVRKPRTPKTFKTDVDGNVIVEEKTKTPRKRREAKSPKEQKTPQKRGPKKRKLCDVGGEEWEALEAEEKRFFSLEDMAATKNATTDEPEPGPGPVESEVADMKCESPVKSETPVEEVKAEAPESEVATSEITPSTDVNNSQMSGELFLDSTPKKRGRKKDIGKPMFSNRSKGGAFSGVKRRGGPGRKKKNQMDESDEDGMITTPPPSPGPGDDSENPNKRRSARNTQRKKYCDDIMLAISDEDSPKSPTPDGLHNKGFIRSGPIDAIVKPNFVYVNTTDEDSMVVQHILAVRRGKREVKVPVESSAPKPENAETEEAIEIKTEKSEESSEKKEEEAKPTVKEESETKGEEPAGEKRENAEEAEGPSQVDSTTEKDPVDNKTETKTEIVDVDEYFVKYRNFSYLHCEWKTEEELRRGDRRIFSKIKRFQQKMSNNVNIFEYLEDEPFNPDFIEIDRVLDVAEHTDPGTNTTVKHYLVKWRSMQYEDSTWELEVDVDPLAIKQFEKFRKIPPKEKCKFKRRPHPDQWRKLEKSPVYKNNNTLRLYQLEGLNWLLFSWHNGRNCILADEMGLGKTIQSLAFINSVHQYGIRGPFLVIAPLSTIPNWQREFEAWTDLNVVVYHGSAASLQMIQEYEFYFKNDKGQLMKDLHRFNVLITTFELIITHSQELKGFNWRICVIDEAHRLKNRNCKLLEGLRLLNMEHRVLLSGTPLQNNVNELFSLLNFLEPSQFSSSEAFLQEFGALKTETEVSKLQAILKPMMLRRMKEDVEKSLAPKEETVVEVELTNIQKKYYRGILERNFSFLSKGTTSSNIPNLMNTMMELRKCCIHPYLLNGAEEQIQIDYKNVHGDDPDAYFKALIHSSGKMVLVDKLLPKLKSNGHRVLIFSQMVKCLDILEDYLIYRKYPFERIDGRIRGDLRQAAIDRFCRPDSDRFVFLLCTKAGGLGINLTAADTVIIYDSDWNPQNDLQAQARCHRIGQQKMVKVYRLICRNTYEREMFDKASLKLGLDKAVLQSMNTTQGGKDNAQKQLSKKEIEDLLKRGAYGAIMDEDSAGDKFCEEDIDQILERRTQVITLESEKGSTFSKASFASSGIRSDINVDDPDFWKKWAKKADIDTTEKDENEQLVVSEPRRRTQIKRYGQDEAALDMSDLGESSGPSVESDDDTSLGVGRGRGKKSKFRKRRRHQHFHHSLMGEEFGLKDGGDIQYGSWSRSECFKVEKGLLTFGWDRWPDIMYHTQFRKGWRMQTVEDCARVILIYCLRYYRGDEKIRNFIWDLITPCENGPTKIGKNHHGLSAPVPRGRNLTRSKNKNKDRKGSNDSDHWSNSEKYDGEAILESNYKKHLSRHANKVLLRVRLLYYIKHEIIGDLVYQINEGVHASALPINPPACDQAPTSWWDSEADKSLLVGTFKHGYECYSLMRNDPLLCFLARVGPDQPGQERNSTLDEDVDKDTEEDTMEGDNSNAAGTGLNEENFSASVGGENSNAGENPNTPDTTVESTVDSVPTPAPAVGSEEMKQEGKLDWPTIGDLNTRLRRVITSYQKNFRKEEIRQLQKARKIERREKIEQIVREREKIRLEISQKKWSRREEVDFFRTIAVFGVEYDKNRKQYDWTKFKSLSRLDKKTDESMTEYYNAFYTMLKRSCGLKILEDEECQDLMIEPLNEERARKTLEVIELLSKIREEILPHPRLDQRLRLCKTSADVPDWWIPGKHDKDLLKGVAKHGIGRTDYYLLNDPELSFKDVVKMSLVDDPASFLREKFAESFKAEAQTKAETEAEKVKESKPVKTEVENAEQTNKEVKEEDTEQKEETEVAAKVEKEGGEPMEVVEETNKEDATTEEKEVEKEKEETNEAEKKQPEVETEGEKEAEKENETEKAKSEGGVSENEDDSQLTASKKPGKKLKKKGKQRRKSGGSESAERTKSEEGIDDDMPGEDEADADGDDEAEEDELKTADESVYDFEDELDTKKEKLTHERTSKKPSEEKPEEVPKAEETENSTPKETVEEIVKQEKSEQEEKTKETPAVSSEAGGESEKLKSEAEVKKESGISNKEDFLTQAAKLQKAFNLRKPFKEELEIIQPWARLHDLDQFLWRDRCSPAPSEPSLAQLIAHSYQNPIKWPRDHAILVRLQHIIHAVEYKEWPVSSNFSAYSAANLPTSTLDFDISARNTPEHSKRDSSTPMSLPEGSEVITITTDHAPKHHMKKKKHHIAIDVETERAKLHALLNCAALGQSQHQNMKSLPIWEANDESLSEDSRRSTPVSLQPPPAHQQTSRPFTGIPSNLTMPFDLSKYHSSSGKVSLNSSGSSNSLAPMDLSSGLSKSEHFKSSKDSEAQDLSIAQDLSSKSKQSVTSQKSKLENTLDKLLKRKNCPPEEPIVDKEKKRRKLDQIVLGLSAAKEQQNTSSLFGDLKKTSLSPSVTVTPASAHPPPASTPASKPFTITVTSVPASSSSGSSGSGDQERKKDNFSSFLTQAEQQHGKLLLKQQQQLLQQQNLLQQQALSSLTSSQSRKSYEAMVADLSKVADFSKLGSYSHDPKMSGSKAPSLKRLAQWLMENPMYDVDPKWAELIKERGNLPHDLQKRLSSSSSTSSSSERKNKSSGRPQVLASPPETATSSSSAAASQASLATSMASSLSFPSLASAGLGSLPASSLAPGLLSGLSLGNFDPKNPLFDVKNNPLFDPKTNPFLDPKNHPLFDPKNLSLLDPKNPLFDPKNSALFDPKNNPFFDPKNNPLLDAKNNPLFDPKNNPLFDPKNPLLLPFGGLSNMGALGGMGPLSNSMNFFANLASMGLPSLSGLDPGASGTSAALPADQASPGSSSGKGKSRKSTGESERHSASKTPPVSSASSSSSSTPTIPNTVAGGLPFYFPNPSLLYSPLGLGGLNPFSLPPAALSSAYDNLAQQCGLLNGGLGASTSGTQSSRSNGGHRSQNSSGNSKMNISSSSPSSSHRHHRSGRDSMDRHNLQHLLLPHDAHLLESLGRVSSMEAALRGAEKRSKDGAERKDSSERGEKRSRENEVSGKSSSGDFGRSEERQARRSKSEHEKKDPLSTQSLLMSSLSEMDDRMLRRLREPDMKEALDALSRSHAELLAKSMSDSGLKGVEGRDVSSLNMSDLISRTIEEHSAKRPKETSVKEALALSGTSITEVKSNPESNGKKFSSSLFSDVPESGAKSLEISADVTIKKKTREKTGSSKSSTSGETSTKSEPSKEDTPTEKDAMSKVTSEGEANEEAEDASQGNLSKTPDSGNRSSLDSAEKSDEATDQEPQQSDGTSTETPETSKGGSNRGRRGRQGKKGKGKSDQEEQPVVERKNLRSSAGRAARAAAERAALKESGKGGSEKSEDEDEQKNNENRDES